MKRILCWVIWKVFCPYASEVSNWVMSWSRRSNVLQPSFLNGSTIGQKLLWSRIRILIFIFNFRSVSYVLGLTVPALPSALLDSCYVKFAYDVWCNSIIIMYNDIKYSNTPRGAQDKQLLCTDPSSDTALLNVLF